MKHSLHLSNRPFNTEQLHPVYKKSYTENRTTSALKPELKFPPVFKLNPGCFYWPAIGKYSD
jgi:hypothetical protein